MEQAIKDLFSILDLPALDVNSLKVAQRILLNNWVNEYIEEFEIENSVIKTNLSSEEEDFLKYYLAHQIAEKLLDDHSTVVSSDNKIKVKVLTIKKHFPKNKD